MAVEVLQALTQLGVGLRNLVGTTIDTGAASACEEVGAAAAAACSETARTLSAAAALSAVSLTMSASASTSLLLQVLLCLLQLGLLLLGAFELLCHPVCKLLRLLQLLGGWQRLALLGPQLLELALDVVNLGLVIAFIGVKAVAQDLIEALDASEELANLLDLFVDGISAAGCVIVARPAAAGAAVARRQPGQQLWLPSSPLLEGADSLSAAWRFLCLCSCFALEAQLPFCNARLRLGLLTAPLPFGFVATSLALGGGCDAAELPTRVAEAVFDRDEVMASAAFPVLAIAASAFGWRHAGGAVVAGEKLGSSGNRE